MITSRRLVQQMWSLQSSGLRGRCSLAGPEQDSSVGVDPSEPNSDTLGEEAGEEMD